MLIDVAGPHPLAIDGEVLDALAAGRRLVEAEVGEFGWIVPASDVENPPPLSGHHRQRCAVTGSGGILGSDRFGVLR